MRLQDRIDSYAATFPKRPPLQLVTEGAGEDKHEVLYGQLVIGNDYTNGSGYYGAYPHGYLERIAALFPDVPQGCDILHVFSGSLPAGNYHRLDINPDLKPDYIGSVYEVRALAGENWRLILADPPYTAADANRYKTPMVDRGRATRALAEVCKPGGHLVWLDCCWPMHRKSEWRTVGRIGLTRSTNHRVRMVSIFERVAT